MSKLIFLIRFYVLWIFSFLKWFSDIYILGLFNVIIITLFFMQSVYYTDITLLLSVYYYTYPTSDSNTI